MDVYARDRQGKALANSRARDPEAVSWSAIGALRAWLLGEEDPYEVIPKNNGFLESLQELHGIRSISEWNNAEGRTAEEVADTLESVERALGYRTKDDAACLQAGSDLMRKRPAGVCRTVPSGVRRA